MLLPDKLVEAAWTHSHRQRSISFERSRLAGLVLTCVE
jgi:hypothetical protein